jgi:hypothetical protein
LAALVKLGFAAVLIWATFLLALGAKTNGGSRTASYLAALVVGLASAVQVWSALITLLQGDLTQRKLDVKRAVENRLAEIYDDDILDQQFTKVTAHVWTVPLWYRRLFPYKFRNGLRSVLNPSMQRYSLTPTLERTCCFSLSAHSPSGILFHKGYGLVGIALAHDLEDKIIYVDFEAQAFKDALKSTEEEWKNFPLNITYGLSLHDAREISRKYGQALAIVIKHITGEAVGCLTLEVAPCYPKRLKDCTDLDRHLSFLTSALGPMIVK